MACNQVKLRLHCGKSETFQTKYDYTLFSVDTLNITNQSCKINNMGTGSILSISAAGTFESVIVKHARDVNASSENNNSNTKQATFCKRALLVKSWTLEQHIQLHNMDFSISVTNIFFFSTVQVFSLGGSIYPKRDFQGFTWYKQLRMVQLSILPPPSFFSFYFTENCVSSCQRCYTQNHSLCKKRARMKKKSANNINIFACIAAPLALP